MFQLSFLYKEQRGEGLSCCQEACSNKFEAVDGLSFCEQEFQFNILSNKIREKKKELISENLMIRWLT